MAGAVIGFGLWFVFGGPNWTDADYGTTGPRDGLIIAALAAVAGGTYTGATLERPRVHRADLMRQAVSTYVARNMIPDIFGPNTIEVRGLFQRMGTMPVISFDDLVNARDAALKTPWATQFSEILRGILQGIQPDELNTRNKYLQETGAAAASAGRSVSLVSRGGAPADMITAKARMDTAVDLALAVAAKPYVSEHDLRCLWQPFEEHLPLSVAAPLRWPTGA
jgi:hypothetical protein